MAQRNGFNGRTVALVGGSGFLGTRLAQVLLARGARLRIACRHPEHAQHIKPLELFLDGWMERFRKHGRFGGWIVIASPGQQR